MREVRPDELLESSDDPFVHHHLDLGEVERAWVAGPAVVVQHRVEWLDAPAGVTAMLCLGPAAALDPLLGRVGGIEPDPWRVVVDSTSARALPIGWRPVESRPWHWMATRSAPPAPDRTESRAVGAVVAVRDDLSGAEVDEVLDQANPGSFARSGTPGIEVWLGVRSQDGRPVAVGALLRQQRDATGHLRAITTLRAHRGRGYGEAISAALTARAVASGSGLATLGVYTDNAVAVRLYRRLGFEIAHTFASGRTSK